MMRKDHERVKARQEDDAADGALDQELDAALAKYAAVEPRAGLEQRVFANLRAQQSRARHRAWWRWSAALAVFVLTAVLLWRWEKPSRPLVVVRPADTTQGPPEQPKQFVSNSVPRGLRPPTSSLTRKKSRHASPVVATEPKLDQFPSPQPLSEQEKILASYVAQYPERSVLIARARSQEMRRELEEMMASPSDKRPTISDETKQ